MALRRLLNRTNLPVQLKSTSPSVFPAAGFLLVLIRDNESAQLTKVLVVMRSLIIVACV